MIYFNPYSANV